MIPLDQMVSPTLLVFGAYPKMSQLDLPAPTIAQRATAVKKAISEEVTNIAVQDALNPTPTFAKPFASLLSHAFLQDLTSESYNKDLSHY